MFLGCRLLSLLYAHYAAACTYVHMYARTCSSMDGAVQTMYVHIPHPLYTDGGSLIYSVCMYVCMYMYSVAGCLGEGGGNAISGISCFAVWTIEAYNGQFALENH